MTLLCLLRYSHAGRSNEVDQTSHMLTIATRDLFNELDKSVKPVAPMQFWMVCSFTSHCCLKYCTAFCLTTRTIYIFRIKYYGVRREYL